MNHRQSYRPHTLHTPADHVRADTCDTRRFPAAPSAAPCPVQPLKGLRENRAHILSYRALAPAGAGSVRWKQTTTVQHLRGRRWLHTSTTANYSLLTANSSYTFSAKEKDSETGLSYFGSRYYSSDLSIWLSVDPMSDKYPSLSSYVYCADNPVKLVDPNGEAYGIPPWLLIKGIARIVEATSNNPDVKTVAYAINHPINAARTGTVDIPSWGFSKTASNFEINVAKAAGITRGEGSQGNAYRHTLWQSMLTANFGEKQAARIGNVHEESLPSNMSQRFFGDMSQADQMADLLNNAIGREIGSRNRGASNRELAEAVLNKYKENGLWTVSGSDKTGYEVQKTRLTQDQYNAALKEIRTKGENGLNK